MDILKTMQIKDQVVRLANEVYEPKVEEDHYYANFTVDMNSEETFHLWAIDDYPSPVPTIILIVERTELWLPDLTFLAAVLQNQGTDFVDFEILPVRWISNVGRLSKISAFLQRRASQIPSLNAYLDDAGGDLDNRVYLHLSLVDWEITDDR